jgi:hypothetical protein
MEKLAHGIAVLIGFAIWMLSENIIVAVIVALVAEGIVVVLLTVAKQAKEKSEAQLAAWQAGEAGPPSARKLWWRIVILVVVGLPTVLWTVAIIIILIMAALDNFKGTEPALLIAIPLITVALCILTIVIANSLIKAIKWNKPLKQPSNYV